MKKTNAESGHSKHNYQNPIEYDASSQKKLPRFLIEPAPQELVWGSKIDEKQCCCGCTACDSICPKRAITMIEDIEGFLYPSVNQDLCVNCHLCEKVCPIMNPTEEVKKKQNTYLIRHCNELVLKQSTSGGAFTAVAQVVLKQGGVVFGAAFDEHYEVRHISVEREEDLQKFRNSKYVQSNPCDTFRQVKMLLNQGRTVLYSGTPCQIEGLRAFLGSDSDNLYLVDLVCHSVPSPLIWRKYKAMRNVDHCIPVAFRDKRKFGYEYSQISFQNDRKVTFSGVESDPYLRAFFSDMSVRPSCYQCKFKKRYRESDLTLWDCFDIYKLDKTLDDNKGVTRCLVHSKKGEKLLERAKEFATVKKIDTEKALNGVRELVASVQMNPQRQAFFADAVVMEDKAFFDKWFPITIKVRIKRLGRRILEAVGIYRLVKRLAKKVLSAFS